MFKKILIGVAGIAVGAGAFYAYNRFVGGAPADDCADEYEDDDVADEEPAAE